MEYKRECPECGKEVCFTNKYNRNAAVKQKRPCKSCSSIAKNKKYGNNKYFIERYGTKGKNTGKDNAFYGRKHSEESKKKISQNRDMSFSKTDDFKKKISKVTSGKNNPMYGKTYYDIWVLKYGKEEADKREEVRRKKLSKALSGENNPMYGKPSPQGSGNGWSGWYKGWFFRSLKELSYMINVIEKNNSKWRTAETKDLRIPYIDYKGDNRTYTADFLVDEEELIEVKPEKLKSSITVRLKAKAARKFCKEQGLVYKIVDVVKLTKDKIKELHDKQIIKFTKRYEALYFSRVRKI